MNSTGTMLTSRRRMYSRMAPSHAVRWPGGRRRPGWRRQRRRWRPGAQAARRLRAARLADHERNRHDPIADLHFASLQLCEEGLGGHLSQLYAWMRDRGERRCGVARLLDVVKP